MGERPPTAPGELKSPPRESGLESYQRVAETVGGVPSLRVKDNVVQALVVLGSGAIGAGVGAALVWTEAVQSAMWFMAVVCGVGGMVVSTLISGLVLMVLGFVRAAKGKK